MKRKEKEKRKKKKEKKEFMAEKAGLMNIHQGVSRKHL